MNHNFASRAKELSCRRDINFMYLLEGSPIPDNAALNKIKAIALQGTQHGKGTNRAVFCYGRKKKFFKKTLTNQFYSCSIHVYYNCKIHDVRR